MKNLTGNLRVIEIDTYVLLSGHYVAHADANYPLRSASFGGTTLHSDNVVDRCTDTSSDNKKTFIQHLTDKLRVIVIGAYGLELWSTSRVLYAITHSTGIMHTEKLLLRTLRDPP